MKTIIVDIDNESNAKTLSDFLKSLNYVKSVKYFSEIDSEAGTIAEEDWIKPGRPATEEEFEDLIKKAETSKSIPAEDSKSQNLKKLDEWAMINLS
jgi:hypothetical protein